MQPGIDNIVDMGEDLASEYNEQAAVIYARLRKEGVTPVIIDLIDSAESATTDELHPDDPAVIMAVDPVLDYFATLHPLAGASAIVDETMAQYAEVPVYDNKAAFMTRYIVKIVELGFVTKATEILESIAQSLNIPQRSRIHMAVALHCAKNRDRLGVVQELVAAQDLYPFTVMRNAETLLDEIFSTLARRELVATKP